MAERGTARAPSQSSREGGTFMWPVASGGTITSPYGWRTHPISGSRNFHRGVDIATSFGTTIRAARGGTVVASTSSTGYGRYVVIRHDNGYYTLYAHNSRNLVSEGEAVSRGQAIAEVGQSGSATGNHVHFEVRRGSNSRTNTVNPLNFFSP